MHQGTDAAGGMTIDDLEAAIFARELSVALLRWPTMSMALAIALAAPLAQALAVGGRVFHLRGKPAQLADALSLVRGFYGADKLRDISASELLSLAADHELHSPASLVIVTGIDALDARGRTLLFGALDARYASERRSALPRPMAMLFGAAAVAPSEAPAWFSELRATTAASRWRAAATLPSWATVLPSGELVEIVRLMQGRPGDGWLARCSAATFELIDAMRKDRYGLAPLGAWAMFGSLHGDTVGLFAPVAAARHAANVGVLGWHPDLGEQLACAYTGDLAMNHLNASAALLAHYYPTGSATLH